MRIAKFAAPALMVALAGCATPFRTEVSRFSAPAVAEARGSFTIAPTDPQRSGSLEFQTYAQYVARELESRGFRQTASDAGSDYVVTLDYGVGQGQQVIETRPGFGGYGGFGGFGYGGFGYGGFGYGRLGYGRFGFYDPFWGPGFGGGFGGFGGGEIYSYTQYPSRLALEIRARGGPVLFEGRALAETRSRDLTRIVPKLVQALFTDYPGRSGQTVIVRIDDQGRASTRLADARLTR